MTKLLNNFVNQNLPLLLFALVAFNLAVIFVVVCCFVKLLAIKKKSEVFFQGKEGKNLEDLIIKNSCDIKDLDKEIQELYNISNKIHNLSLKSIHKFGVVRFNPFGDIGGDQSFCAAFLDGKNNGLVISSLHTKEGTRVYSKPVVKGESEKYQLTEEEKQAIKLVTQNKSNKI